MIQQACVQGISTRPVDNPVQATGGTGASKSEVSRLCAAIDSKAGAFPRRPVEGDWPCVWIDATWLKVRENHRIVPVAVTIAGAVHADGRREVIGKATGPTEAETFWTDFLRGLPRAIFSRASARDIREQRDKVTGSLRVRHLKLGQLMDDARKDVLAFTGLPKEHWTKIYSTKPPGGPMPRSGAGPISRASFRPAVDHPAGGRDTVRTKRRMGGGSRASRTAP